MTFLSLLLAVKIAVTLPAVALPFLTLSPERLDRIGGLGAPPAPVARLYGVGVLALCTAYAGGLIETLGGAYPAPVVFMGIVSNAGAVVVFLRAPKMRMRGVSIAFFGAVALGFALAAAFPGLSMAPLR